MKFIAFFFLSAVCFGNVSAQARLMLNDNPYIVMNGNVYLVLANSNPNAITSMVAGVATSNYTDGRIISEGENNKVKWFAQAATGDYIIPFYYSTGMIPLRFNITSAGTEAVAGTAYFAASTWWTSANATWPSGSSLCGAATENDVMDRFWVIDCGAATGYSANPTATMRFYYRETAANTFEGELASGFTETDFQAQHWDASMAGACKWVTPPVGTAVPASNYVEVTGVNSFSPWALTNKNVPLPIELLAFTGECNDKRVILRWETASETNNDFFTVERSMDGGNFESIGVIHGAGNSNINNEYDFTDVQDFSNRPHILYYRLKQTDFDGMFSYSGIIAVQNCNIAGNGQVAIFIGSNNEILMSINSPADKRFNVSFYDETGRKVHSEIMNIKEGANIKMLNPQRLSTGIYFISLQNEEEVLTQKLFIH